jgi:hypothetical protein
MMAASHLAAECLPAPGLEPGDATRELDHILAMTFAWWDLVVRGRTPVSLVTAAPPKVEPTRALPPAEPVRALPLALDAVIKE